MNNLDPKSLTRTFQKGDDYGKMVEWLFNQFETDDYQPEGTDWSGGEPGPMDPRCDLKHKYRITITKIESK
jgi:hypothetical protein